MTQQGELWRSFLADGKRLAESASPFEVSGRLTRINGLVMEASGLKLPLGSGCRVLVPGGGAVEAEVVGFNGEKIYMMPTDDVFGLAPGAQVLPSLSHSTGKPRDCPGFGCCWGNHPLSGWSSPSRGRSSASSIAFVWSVLSAELPSASWPDKACTPCAGEPGRRKSRPSARSRARSAAISRSTCSAS